MSFNQQVLENLGAIFFKNGFIVTEQYDNYIRFESNAIRVALSYDNIEKSNTIWIGRNMANSDQIELTDTVMRNFFYWDLKMSFCVTGVFLENLRIFFNRQGKSLLEGDLNKMVELEKYDLERNHLENIRHNEQIDLNEAEKAWAEKNYNKFINCMNRIDEKKWSPSYKLKYKMARDRIKN